MALTKVQNTGIGDDGITTDKIEKFNVCGRRLSSWFGNKCRFIYSNWHNR